MGKATALIDDALRLLKKDGFITFVNRGGQLCPEITKEGLDQLE